MERINLLAERIDKDMLEFFDLIRKVRPNADHIEIGVSPDGYQKTRLWGFYHNPDCIQIKSMTEVAEMILTEYKSRKEKEILFRRFKKL